MAQKLKTKSKNIKASFLPTAGYILIEPSVTETKTVGGIYLAENVTGEKPQKGKVIAIGADDTTEKQWKKSPAKIGEVVIYKKWGGNEVREDGKDYIFVKFEDVLAIVK